MLCINAAYSVMWHLSVCLSVTFVDSVETNKHKFNIFQSTGSHTIPLFLHQISWQNSDGHPLNAVSDIGWAKIVNIWVLIDDYSY